MADEAWDQPERIPPEERLAAEALIVDVDGFEGPLDLLLTLSRTQKVDLRKISVLQLAERFWPIAYHVAVDGLSLVFLLLTALLILLTMLYGMSRGMISPGRLYAVLLLAEAGLVAWPDPARVTALRAAFEALPRDTAWFQATLAELGYGVPQTGTFDTATRDALAAFQMRFRPALYDGTADAETAALLAALAEMRR